MRKLPAAEFVIMKVIWFLEPPVTSGELLEGLAKETRKIWRPQTLHTLLCRLSDRGFVRLEKRGKEKISIPLVEREAYMRFETKGFMGQFHDGSLLNLVNAMYQGEKLSDAEIDELINWANAQRGDGI